MSRWFRHYAGMMRDEKLVRVSIRSGQSIERVTWIWGAILESAAELDDGGRYDIDSAEIAYFLRTDEADVAAVLAALADAARLAENRVVRWGDRQFVSDRSAARVAAHRERKRAERGDADASQRDGNDTVTLHRANGNGAETHHRTETETDSEIIEPNGSCPADAARFTVKDFVESWNETANLCGLPRITRLTDRRKRAFAVRQREYPDIEDWRRAFRCLRDSPWLHGENKNGWRADPDFFLQAKSFTKLVEGSYGQAH